MKTNEQLALDTLMEMLDTRYPDGLEGLIARNVMLGFSERHDVECCLHQLRRAYEERKRNETCANH